MSLKTQRGKPEERRNIYDIERLAGEPGFEPGLTESESAGLPLTYSPIDTARLGVKMSAEMLRLWW